MQPSDVHPETPSGAARAARIPLALKIFYTAFCAILVPYYWINYGPANLCYFCDIALLVTLVGLWIESPLLFSTQALAILLPQVVWIADFLSIAIFGKGPLAMTDYMFNRAIPLFVRGLSTFHIWLPILLAWLVWRYGYDRRALLIQIICGWAVLCICYFILPGPPAPPHRPNAAVNVNFVYGITGDRPQTWMHPHLWFAFLMLLIPAIYVLTHFALKALCGRPSRR